MLSRFFQGALFLSFAFPWWAEAISSHRFEFARKALDEVHSKCSENDVCVLVNFRYTPAITARYEGQKHFGGLDARARITMIKVSPIYPWLTVNPKFENLKAIDAPLFPQRGGNTEENGLIFSEFLVDGNQSIHKTARQLNVKIEYQTNIYKEAQELLIGSVEVPQMPIEHEIHPPRNPNPLCTTGAFDDRYVIGWLLPLKINNNVKIKITQKQSDLLKTYRIVGVPNQYATSPEDEGVPYTEDFISFGEKRPVYQMHFFNLENQQSITTLETADYL